MPRPKRLTEEEREQHYKEYQKEYQKKYNEKLKQIRRRRKELKMGYKIKQKKKGLIKDEPIINLENRILLIDLN